MKRKIYNKINKDEINSMPTVLFEGNIRLVCTEKEAKKAVEFLFCQDVLGIDTETRPSFKKGVVNHVSLLQVSTFDDCFLFRLNRIGITEDIKKLLENTRIPMVGLSLHDDLLALKKRSDFIPGEFIDLQDYVKCIGIEDQGLQKLYANVFRQKISKRQQLTNWDNDVLTEKQTRYAATDAWACLMLYKEINRLNQTGDYEIVIKEDKVVE